LLNSEIVDLSSIKGITSHIKNGVNVAEQCSQGCSLYGSCRYTRFLRSVNKGGYDFQVTNHNLFLADMLLRAHDKKPIVPEYQAIIIDEAHKFFDAAQDMYGSELSLSELYKVVHDISGFKLAPGQQANDMIRWAEKIYSKSRLLFQFLNKEVPGHLKGNDEVERFATKIRGRTDKLIRDLRKDIDLLAEVLSGLAVTSKYTERHKYSKRALSHISETLGSFTKHKNLVYWLEKNNQKTALNILKTTTTEMDILCGMSKNMGTLLYRDCWSKKSRLY
jgi:ATP-dependent DNA helicase DinG